MIAQVRDVAAGEIQDALTELQATIRARFPAAVFEAFPNDDPAGVYLRVTVDIEDPDEVIDAILPRLVEMQVEEGLPIYPVAVRPIERVLADADARSRRLLAVPGDEAT